MLVLLVRLAGLGLLHSRVVVEGAWNQAVHLNLARAGVQTWVGLRVGTKIVG